MITGPDFERAYEAGMPLTRRLLMARGCTPDTAEEYSQAAWTRGWERRGQLRNEGAVQHWVNSIALNFLRTDARTRHRREDYEKAPEPTVPPEPVAAKPDAELALRTVGTRYGRMLYLHEVEGFTCQEIAERTGSKAVTIRVGLHRARARARKALEFHGHSALQAA